MSAPSVILQKPKVIVTPSSSVQGFITDDARYIFGTITNIYESSDTFQIGQSVLFPPAKSFKFAEDSIDYYVVDEFELFFSEEPLPP
jgi:hypothetical protein